MRGAGPPQRIAALRATFDRVTARAARPYIAMGLLLVIAIALAGHEVDRHLIAIETWIRDLGLWGVTAFIGLYIVLTSLLLPGSVVGIVAGTLFGLRLGFAAVATGAVLAAAAQYALSRHLLRRRIQRALDTRPSLAAIQRAVAARQLRLQVLLRVTPLNPATLSYLLGAAGVRFGGFMVAFLASTPHLLAEVYVGYAGRHVAHMAGRQGAAVYVHDAVVLGGLALAVTALVLVGRAARAAVLEAVARTETPPAGQLGSDTQLNETRP